MSLSMESHRCPPRSAQTSFPLDTYGASASHKGFNGKKRKPLLSFGILSGYMTGFFSVLLAGGRRAGNDFEEKIKEGRETLKEDAKYAKKKKFL